ncbi:MAG TPA: TetR/AcrR family transcriptional regulator [Blastocatellia bacterium]|nr:TetR/AcrR family transcriptional regulator [Blastocatellia bacterium]
MSAKILAAKQTRSKESLNRLLKAAAEIMAENGLEGATIPRIAARAGLSPGAVYRRFPDKDALIQNVVLKMLQSNDEGVERLLQQGKLQNMGLKDFVELIIGKTIIGYRTHAPLVRAVHTFVRSHTNAAFRRKARQIEMRTFKRVTEFLLTKREEISHPDPEIAFPFSLLLNAFTMKELIVEEVFSKSWATLLPKDDAGLQRELTRVILNYLGVKSK